MELFGKSKQAWLQQLLDLPNGIPSHDTFGRVFARLNPKHFHQCFLSWTQAVSKFTQGAGVSLDGKTVKASFDRATELSPVHVVSAWCSQNGGLVMGQLKTHSKSNEITAIPELLKLLAIKGCIVTIDAMGCQRAIIRQILDQQGDYLVTLKGNHKSTYRAVTRYFHDHVEHNFSLRDEDTFFDAFDASGYDATLAALLNWRSGPESTRSLRLKRSARRMPAPRSPATVASTCPVRLAARQTLRP